MALAQKGKSPFYPGQPVPVELFLGRAPLIEHIMKRGVHQVVAGKPIAMYIQGEYGIGKSSIASFVQWQVERAYKLHSIYVSLGRAENLNDVGAAILEATLRSGVFDPKKSERIRNWLATYIGDPSLFGLSLHMEKLKKDAPTIANGPLPFFSEALTRLKDTGVAGIFLVLDEINGITSNPKFAHFIKDIVDTNAMSRSPLPLLLMVCGVEEKRREMIEKHQPIDRIFDVLEVDPMTKEEMDAFFIKAFKSVQMEILPEALEELSFYSAGFPKIIHLVGDAAYWIDQDGTIDRKDAQNAVLIAADEVGKKYVDQQVYKALRSPDYHSILAKIAKLGPGTMNFKKSDLISVLTDTEKKKFNNFLRKMKALKVLRSGDVQGEYLFNVRMVCLYIWMQSIRKGKKGE